MATLARLQIQYRGVGKRCLGTSTVANLLGITSYLLIPSLVAEAMALGVPCIGFDVGGIRDQIGTSGLTLPFDHRLAADADTHLYQTRIPDEIVEFWVKTIESLLQSQEKYVNLASSALQKAKRFRPEHTIQRWQNELSRLKTL